MHVKEISELVQGAAPLHGGKAAPFYPEGCFCVSNCTVDVLWISNRDLVGQDGIVCGIANGLFVDQFRLDIFSVDEVGLQILGQGILYSLMVTHLLS